jgi:pimeloyl-ACP methyl ester carboxylesterase
LGTQTTGITQHGLKGEFIDVLGARMHYVRTGSGPALLLIHGIVGSESNWRRNIAALAQNASVYALDLVNMGKSQRVAGADIDLEATADRVAACMDALGLDQADIAGHSHGGAVALMLAARHPERVRSLILFAPINPFNTFEKSLIRLYKTAPGRMLARCAPYLPRPVQLIALGRMYGDPARIVKETLGGYIDGMRVAGTVDHILAIVRGWYADLASLKAALPLVAQVPTLLIWGDRDRAVSVSSGMKLHRELPESELVIISGGGHVVFEEMPEECDRAMVRWLSRNRISSTPEIYAQPHTAFPVARPPLASTLQQVSRQA